MSDPFKDIEKIIPSTSTMMKFMDKVGQSFKKSALEKSLAAYPYLPTTKADCLKAIKNGEDYEHILEADRRVQAEKKKVDEFVRKPPPIHGSADWTDDATLKELGLLHDFAVCPEKPDGIYLGGLRKGTGLNSFPDTALHWTGDSHLLTIAPTRTGKAISQIIPNLLRYRGSCVVLDPKGELFHATSKWRHDNVGAVYVLNPFDVDGFDGFTHGFNPLDNIKTDVQAMALSNLIYPSNTTQGQDFFDEEARNFLAAFILYFARYKPPEQRTMQALRNTLATYNDETKALLDIMRSAHMPSFIRNEAENFQSKVVDVRSRTRVFQSMNTHMRIWDSEGIQHASNRSDFDFADLKDKPATVYLVMPFDQLKAYSTYVNVVMSSALHAMLHNKNKPDIPVLFVMDEFLALDPIPDFVDALRTHAGAGVRLWFFLQDKNALEDKYPKNWRSFYQAEVKCYFGTDDHFTAQEISDSLGEKTIAYMGGGTSGTTGGSAHYSLSTNVQTHGRKLMTAEEIVTFLSRDTNMKRSAIYLLRGAKIQAAMSPWDTDPLVKTRFGSMLDDEEENT